MGVRKIFKDSRGLLWLGTEAGLCTFDGKTFRTLLPSEGMTANQIWSIAEDDDGNLWFGSFGDGLYKYDGKRFTRFTRKDGLRDDRIRVLHYSRKFNCLLAGSYGCVSLIRGDSILSFPPEQPGAESIGTVTGIAEADSFFYLSIYGPWGPARFYPGENRLVSLRENGGIYPPTDFSVFISSRGDTVFSDYTRGVWIRNRKGILRLDTLGQVFGIAEDKRGNLWMASWSARNSDLTEGIYRYDGQTIRNFKTAFGISDREVWTLFYDPEQDLLWIGTTNDGLFMVPFTGISLIPAASLEPRQERVNSLFLDSEERLWISGNRDLIRRDTTGTFTTIDKVAMLRAFRKFWTPEKQKNYPEAESARKTALSMDPSLIARYAGNAEFDFGTVVEDTGHVYVFLSRFDCFMFDERTGQITGLGPDRADAEMAVMGDTLITAGWGNTFLNTSYRKGLIWAEDERTLFRGVDYGQPWDINRLVKQGNRYWYASWNSGLWMSRGMDIVNFNRTDSTLSRGLKDICFDKQGHVIFGSINGEICIARLAGDSLEVGYRIRSGQGLQGNSITWLAAGQNGQLWAGTNRGVNCIELDSLYEKGKYVIRFMDEEEGYRGQASGRAVLAPDGMLWIAARDKLICLECSLFGNQQDPPGEVRLRTLTINSLPADSVPEVNCGPWGSLPSAPFVLSHHLNNLTFGFDVLNYLNPGKDRFRFKLEGYDPGWRPWTTERRAIYTNLPPGNYTFLAESANLYSGLNAKPLVVSFSIRQPWWALGYVRLIAVVLLLAAFLAAIHLYLRQERAKQRRQMEIDRKIALLEMQALQAQMNPHFIFNCVNGIQYYVLANKMDEVLKYLSDFSRVVGESLANTSLRMVPLEREMEFLGSYLRLEQMRFPEKFDFEIRYAGETDAGIIKVPPMLVQPFAENAIHHGFLQLTGRGQLSIVFERLGSDLLLCTVTDNGTGRRIAAKRKDPEVDRPHSARITESRIRLFNSPEEPGKYRIVFTDLFSGGAPCGLKVELYLPMEWHGGE